MPRSGGPEGRGREPIGGGMDRHPMPREPMDMHPVVHRRHHPIVYAPRHYDHVRYSSYLGTGLSALVGSAIGTTIASTISNKKAEKDTIKTNSGTTTGAYEVFSYCPNCGKHREGNSTVCSNCGTVLIK